MHDETSDRLLTPRELAAMLRLSMSSVYRPIARRNIPFHRFNRKLRFRLGDVEEFLKGNRVEKIG